MAFIPGSRRTWTPAAVALSLCALTHSYILFNVVPYAGYMVVELLSASTADSVGLYAGLLGTSFALGRTIGFAPWKSIRTEMGEKGSLITSLILSALFSVLFGLSSTFAGALLARFLLGLSNGISGAVKRAALDQARFNGGEDAVEKAPARILAVMSWGCVLGPALGGILSNPLGGAIASNGSPTEWGWWDDSGGTWLEWRPFLLPNIFGAFLCVTSAAMVWAFVQENDTKRLSLTRTVGKLLSSPLRRSPPNGSSGAENDIISGESRPLLPIRANREKGSDLEKIKSALADVWKGGQARRHFAAYWSFSFVAVCIDEALPLFLIARLGGPGLSALDAGLVIAGAGMVLVLCHHCTFESLLGRAGLYPSLRLAAVLGTVPAVLIPVSLKLNGGTCAELTASVSSSIISCGLAPSAFVFLMLLAGSLKVFSAFFFAVAGMVTGRTVPPTHRDEAARIMTLGALFARSVAPTVAGALVSFSVSPSSAAPWDPKYGSIVLWSVIGIVLGLSAAALTISLSEPSSGHTFRNRREAKEDRRSLYLTQRQRAQIYVKLWEVHYDRGSETAGAKWRRGARKVIALNRFKKGFLPSSDEQEMTGVPPKTKENRRASWADRMLSSDNSIEEIPFVILGTHKNDEPCKPHVLTPPLMDALHQVLPFSCSESNFWLKYSLVRDGASFETLANKISVSRYTILAIETMDGDVFGSFNSRPWARTNKYVGGGECFLWRLKKRRPINSTAESIEEHANLESDIEVFRWTGENDLCQFFGDNMIAFGGGLVGGGDGFGLVVEDDLSRGTSSSCITFDNPCLSLSSSENGQFEIANMEVWALTSFMLVADAEKSETRAQFVQENTTADGMWSNFF